jgi:ActR/RegA family two-component response regulator
VVKAGAATSLQRAATQTVLQAFDRCGHSVSRTSRNLGISRTTVYRHLHGETRDEARGLSREGPTPDTPADAR